MYYRGKKPSEKVQALRKKKEEHRFFVAGMITLCLFLGCTAVVLVLRLPVLQITTVAVSGTTIVSNDDVRNHIETMLSGSYAFVIPKRSALVYPKKKILLSLAETFPRLKDLSLRLENTQKISLTTAERAGVYLWCGEVFSNTTPCFYMDEHGYLFAPAPTFSGAIYRKFFGGTIAKNVRTVGNQILETKAFEDITLFADGLEAIGLAPNAVILGQETNELLTSFPVKNNWGRIIVRTDSDLSAVLSYIQAAILVDPLKTKLATNRNGLEYIDLRFDKKVYYKFSDTIVEQSPKTDEQSEPR